jgi:hypothetical protein
VDREDEGGEEEKEYHVFEPVQPEIVGSFIINLKVDLL